MLKLIGATATLGIGMPLAFSFMPEEVCEEKKLVRPVDLPIYESIHEVKIIEKKIEEPCQAQEVVKSVRLGILDGLDFLKQTKEDIIEVYEIGKAHSAASVENLRSLETLKDEENLPLALGATGTIGGILGLIKGRKRKLLGKTIYTFGGAALGTGILYGLLYPEEVTKIYQDVYVEGERLSKIAINFVQGVTPEETSPPKDTSEDLKVLSAEDKASLDKLSPSDE